MFDFILAHLTFTNVAGGWLLLGLIILTYMCIYATVYKNKTGKVGHKLPAKKVADVSHVDVDQGLVP